MSTADKALHDLLCDLFAGDPAGLTRHLALHFGHTLASELPSESVGLGQLAFAAQQVARRHGLLAALLSTLSEARPQQQLAIDRVRDQLDVHAGVAPTPTAAVAPPSPLSLGGTPALDAPSRPPRSTDPPHATWLHLAGLHLAGDDRDPVHDALLELVQRSGWELDLIIVTGDVASTGRAHEYAAATTFFTELLDVAGLAGRRERLIVVPGNHDVDRRAARGLTRTLASEAASQRYFADDHPRHDFAAQAAYRCWHDEFFADCDRRATSDTTCGPLIRLALDHADVAILPINTALFARDADDFNRLWIGRRPLRHPAEVLRSADVDLRLVAMHHPIDWLCDLERASIRTMLVDSADLILFGHHADADVVRALDMDGSVLQIAAGSAHSGAPRGSRLVLGALDGQVVRLRPYDYAEHAQRWVVDPSVFPEATAFEGVFEARPRRLRRG